MLRKNPYILAQEGEQGELYLVDSYHSNIFKIKKERAEEYLTSYQSLSGDEAVLAALKERNIVYDDEEYEIPAYDQLFEEFLRDRGEVLFLILLPTAGCNFRCMYCYEDHEGKVMTQEIQDSVISFVEKNIENYKALRVEWFGGEPLCSSDVVDYISQGLIAVCKQAKKPYTASMTTNGYLLNLDTFRRMLRKNRVVSYQITLDGLEESHNQQRPLANREGSFQTIMANLKAIRDQIKSHLFQITVRCNVTEKVMNSFNEYLDMLSSEFGEDDRFDFYWKIAWEPDHKADDAYCEEEQYDELLEMARNRKLRLGLNRAMLACYGLICYASYPGCFVIGADAAVYKCTVIFDEPRNQIGTLKKDGTMELDKNKEACWSGRIKGNNLSKCKECKIAPSCLGIACRKSYKDAEGNIQCHPSNTHIKKLLSVLDSLGGYVEELGDSHGE